MSSVGTKTLRGLLWSYGSYIGNRAATLLAVAVLARLLTPREFGLVAIAIVFITLLDTARMGLTQALVVSDEEDLESHADSSFVFGMAVALGLSLIGVALAPLVADFYGEPEVLWLMVVLACNFIIRSLGMTHYAVAQRALAFRVRTFAEVGNALARGAVSIALAFAGFGAWSLVIGYLAGSLIFSTILWIGVPFTPRFTFAMKDARHLFGFGGVLTAIDILWALSASAPELIIGRAIDAEALGLYTLGLRLPELLVLNFSIVAAQVFYPAFAALRADAIVDGLRTAYRYTALISLPLTVFLIVMAEPIVLFVFGGQWTDSVGPMQALALYALGIALSIPAGSVLKAIGRPLIVLVFDAARLVLTVIAVLAVVDRGILWVGLAVAAVTMVLAMAETIIPPRLLGFSARALLSEALPAVRATLPLTAVLLGVAWLDLPHLGAIALASLAGGATYLGALWVFDRESVLYVVRKARPGGA